MIILGQVINLENFKRAHKVNLHRAPISTRKYHYLNGPFSSIEAGTDYSNYENLDIDEIKSIILRGNTAALRALSQYYYRIDSNYKNNVDFLVDLPLYDTVVSPVYTEGKGSKAQILKAFYSACKFIDDFDLPNVLRHITKEWILNGSYFGLVREYEGKIIVQDLPYEYCRTRYKDFNNLNILEFNINYFSQYSESDVLEILLTYPPEVRDAWIKQRTSKVAIDNWIEIPASSGGISFSFNNYMYPALIASIIDLKKLDDATDREEKRDENELYKILIHRMPINSTTGQFLIPLEEAAVAHEAVASMLDDIDTVDVLTTFGEATLENLQEPSAATQSSNRLEKYVNKAWTAMGRGNILFNPENSSTLAYQIKKDEAYVGKYLNVYEHWIKFLINERFQRTGLSFDFKILPTTVFNRQDIQSATTRGAQYGYSKMYAGVAMGIKQLDQISLMDFENNLLKMHERMIPLASSYTSSEKKDSGSEGKTQKTTSAQDLSNTGGRPELPDEQKSEKTQANIDAMG